MRAMRILCVGVLLVSALVGTAQARQTIDYDGMLSVFRNMEQEISTDKYCRGANSYGGIGSYAAKQGCTEALAMQYPGSNYSFQSESGLLLVNGKEFYFSRGQVVRYVNSVMGSGLTYEIFPKDNMVKVSDNSGNYISLFVVAGRPVFRDAKLPIGMSSNLSTTNGGRGVNLNGNELIKALNDVYAAGLEALDDNGRNWRWIDYVDNLLLGSMTRNIFVDRYIELSTTWEPQKLPTKGEWSQIGKVDQWTYYINKESLDFSSGSPTMWELMEDSKHSTNYKLLLGTDCKSPRMSILDRGYYDSRGTLRNRVQDAHDKPLDASGDSINADIYAYMCSPANRPAPVAAAVATEATSPSQAPAKKVKAAKKGKAAKKPIKEVAKTAAPTHEAAEMVPQKFSDGSWMGQQVPRGDWVTEESDADYYVAILRDSLTYSGGAGQVWTNWHNSTNNYESKMLVTTSCTDGHLTVTDRGVYDDRGQLSSHEAGNGALAPMYPAKLARAVYDYVCEKRPTAAAN